MSAEGILKQIEKLKKDLTNEEFDLIKSIMDQVKYRQNDCDFEIVNNEFEKKIIVEPDSEFDEKFISMSSYAQSTLRKYLDDYLADKNVDEFYDDFPLIDYLFNGVKPKRPLNEKLLIKNYNSTKIEKNIKFLLDLTDNCRANNKILRCCIILAMYNYIVANYKFCLDNPKFKNSVQNKINSFIAGDDYDDLKYTAFRFGNNDIVKIWYDQMKNEAIEF
jgi:hypothetical protein